MASNVFNSALNGILNSTIDLDADDIRVKLLMNTTTADTDKDAIDNVSDIGTLDLCDATGYADVALTGEAVAVDDVNDRSEFDAANASFTGLSGDASRAYDGCLVYKYVDGTDANDIPIAYVEFTTPIPLTATQVDIPWDAQGILQLAQA